MFFSFINSSLQLIISILHDNYVFLCWPVSVRPSLPASQPTTHTTSSRSAGRQITSIIRGRRRRKKYFTLQKFVPYFNLKKIKLVMAIKTTYNYNNKKKNVKIFKNNVHRRNMLFTSILKILNLLWQSRQII